MKRSWERKINKEDLLKVIEIANEYSPIGSDDDYFVRNFMNDYRWLYLSDADYLGEVVDKSDELVRFDNLSDINLKYLRSMSNSKLKTQEDIARKVGVSSKTYHNKEVGKTLLQVTELDWILEALEYEVELIVRRK